MRKVLMKATGREEFNAAKFYTDEIEGFKSRVESVSYNDVTETVTLIEEIINLADNAIVMIAEQLRAPLYDEWRMILKLRNIAINMCENFFDVGDDAIKMIAERSLYARAMKLSEWVNHDCLIGSRKKCSHCGEVKLILIEFGLDSRSSDNHESRCKECMRRKGELQYLRSKLSKAMKEVDKFVSRGQIMMGYLSKLTVDDLSEKLLVKERDFKALRFLKNTTIHPAEH